MTSIKLATIKASACVPLFATLGFAYVNSVHAEIMVVGIDRKFAYDDNAVRQALEPGHDEVQFFDLKDPLKPKLLGLIAMENSILAPPANVAVTPDQSLALVANSMHSEKTATGWKAVPADELFVIDLRASPPKLVQTLKVGSQPSGIAISKDGKFALIANRDSKTISVLKIDNGAVMVTDTVATGDAVGAIAIMELTRFHGHLSFETGGVDHGKASQPLRAGVSGADGGTGEGRTYA